MDGEKPEGVRVGRLAGTQVRLADGGGGSRSMQRNLETESLQRRQRNREEENHVPDHKTGHMKTGFHGTRMGQPYPGETAQAKAEGVTYSTEGWC